MNMEMIFNLLNIFFLLFEKKKKNEWDVLHFFFLFQLFVKRDEKNVFVIR